MSSSKNCEPGAVGFKDSHRMLPDCRKSSMGPGEAHTTEDGCDEIGRYWT